MTSKSAHGSAAETGADVDDTDEVDVTRTDDANDVGAGDTATFDTDDSGVADTVDASDDDTVEDDSDATDAATDGDASTSGGTRGPEVLPRRLMFGAAALALAAFIVAAVFGVMWLFAATGDDAELASSRDGVSEDAAEAIQAVTEIDYKNPDQFFERSKAVSTEDFGKQLTQAEDQFRELLSKAQTQVETNVQDVAVQELNDHEGTATFLAVVSTHITQQKNETTKVLRLKGQMKREAEGDDWKLAGMGQVPVVGSGAGVGKPQQGGKQQDDGKADQGSGKSSGESGQGSGAGNGAGN